MRLGIHALHGNKNRTDQVIESGVIFETNGRTLSRVSTNQLIVWLGLLLPAV